MEQYAVKTERGISRKATGKDYMMWTFSRICFGGTAIKKDERLIEFRRQRESRHTKMPGEEFGFMPLFGMSLYSDNGYPVVF